MVKINLNLPGWHQIVDEPERKEFLSGDGYRAIIDTSGIEIEMTIEEEKALTVKQ